MKFIGATTPLYNGADYLSITPVRENGKAGSERVNIVARNSSFTSTANLRREDAPAFALAVLEAAGFAADNSCAGDAVRSLKYQIANEAGAAEAAALDKEAEALATAGWEKFGKPLDWPKEVPKFKEHWRAVARKARELHKTEVAK